MKLNCGAKETQQVNPGYVNSLRQHTPKWTILQPVKIQVKYRIKYNIFHQGLHGLLRQNRSSEKK